MSFVQHFRTCHVFRAAAWLALWVMLLPTLVPLAHHPATVLSSNMPPLCHMAMDGADKKQQQSPTPNKAPLPCPICQSLGNLALGFVSPDVVELVVYGTTGSNLALPQQSVAAYTPNAAAWPRAPPQLA